MVKNPDSIPNAVLDANVLYPIHLRDFACWLQWQGAHRMFWSLELGTELRRALNRANSDHQLGNRVWRQLNQAFPDNLKDLHPKIPSGLPDADDEHVAQLASQFQCELVTFNLRDFPADLIKPLVLRHPDDYFLEIVRNQPLRSIEAIRSMSMARNKIPVSQEQLIEALAQNRLPRTAAQLNRLGGHYEQLVTGN